MFVMNGVLVMRSRTARDQAGDYSPMVRPQGESGLKE